MEANSTVSVLFFISSFSGKEGLKATETTWQSNLKILRNKVIAIKHILLTKSSCLQNQVAFLRENHHIFFNLSIEKDGREIRVM